MDPIAQFKENQAKSWASFTPFEMFTSGAAPRLTRFAGISAGTKTLDVGCGTGVAAITAARLGARVTGVDLTPELLTRARDSAKLAQVEVDWHQGDVEALPFADDSFDTVISQFGHMFAPRPEVAVKEMLRVLRPGGTIAFSTWPPELFTGRLFKTISAYLPPPPPGVAAPPEWGDPSVIRERLGTGVKDLSFDRDLIRFTALSPQHARAFMEHNLGMLIKLVQMLTPEPAKLSALRKDIDEAIGAYFENNYLRQDFLITRATKR
ncbi:MAG: class I SAM-dependent methyltransferase [Myxococcota bacterium]